jgi:hypothetical protein
MEENVKKMKKDPLVLDVGHVIYMAETACPGKFSPWRSDMVKRLSRDYKVGPMEMAALALEKYKESRR